MPTRRSNDHVCSPGMLTFGMTDDTGPQFTLHDGAVTAGNPCKEKAIAAARRLGMRLAKG